MQHHHSPIRRHHQHPGVSPLVLSSLDVVRNQGYPVADEESYEPPADFPELRKIRPLVRHASEHNEDENAVNHSKHAVVHDEKRDEGELLGGARAAAREGHPDDVVKADNQVLGPEKHEQQKGVPPQEEYARDRDQVGGDERPDGGLEKSVSRESEAE